MLVITNSEEEKEKKNQWPIKSLPKQKHDTFQSKLTYSEKKDPQLTISPKFTSRNSMMRIKKYLMSMSMSINVVLLSDVTILINNKLFVIQPALIEWPIHLVYIFIGCNLFS